MVYFFARQERHGDVKFWVNELCGRQDLVAEAAEIDILRDPVGHDLGRVEAQQHWRRQLHGYRIVVVTPPGCIQAGWWTGGFRQGNLARLHQNRLA